MFRWLLLFGIIERDQNYVMCQVTVYDDSHMGDYIGVIVHFTNTPTEHAAGGVRTKTVLVFVASLAR